MSNRSRRERRAHQQERALKEGDLQALEKAVEQSPRSAVSLVSRALATATPSPAGTSESALDGLAVRLARKLRRDGDPAQALVLAAAGNRRTPGFRMEEALAAFATGDDARTAALASADATIAAALGPLLQAVRGEVAGASAGSPPLRALHAAARAVAHVVRGEPDQARAVIKRLPMVARGPVLAGEIGVAAGLQAREHALDALASLGRSSHVRRDAEVRRLMAAEAVLDAAQLAALPPALAADPDLLRRTMPVRLAAATSPGAVAEIVRQAGVEVFDAAERAAATLYLGYSQLRADPTAASQSCDRAVQLGADLVESLRGKLLAAMEIAHRPGNAPPHQRFRDAATAADRLAHALQRLPRGGPLAAAAGKLAAMQWIDAGEARPALASIEKSRPLAGGKLGDALDLLEADALALRSPADADRRLDALLRRSPDNVDAWKKRAEIAAIQGDMERADAILLDAAEATKDPGLAAAAREIRGDRGQIAPFEGMIPGVATAGALAKELARTTTEDDDPLPLAALCRDALGPTARLAFDAAALVITADQGPDGAVTARLHAGMLAWRGAPRDLASFSAVALLVGLGSELVAATRALHSKEGDDLPALTAVAEVLAVAGFGKLVGKLLPRIAAGLSRERVAFFKSLAGAGKRQAQIPGVPDPEQAARELDLALAPDFGIEAFLREEKEEDDDLDVFGPGGGDVLGELFGMLGLSPEALLSMPPEMLRRLREKLLEISRRPPSMGTMQAILDALNESGIEPPSARPRRRR